MNTTNLTDFFIFGHKIKNPKFFGFCFRVQICEIRTLCYKYMLYIILQYFKF